MSDGPYIAGTASLIGDPARANMLAALMDGRALTATELGLAAGIAPSTASGHLSKLVAGGLILVSPAGRRRYFRLASPAVARLLESLMVFASDGPPRHQPKCRVDAALARARTCYDHLAGKLEVALAESLSARGHLILSDEGGLVTDSGGVFLAQLGIDVRPAKGSRRPLCWPCLDWTERRWHIGGALGAAIARRCFELGWTKRQKHGRAVTVTPAGEQALELLFGVRFKLSTV